MSTAGRAGNRLARRAAIILVAVIATVTLLNSCHPLVNPADPRSILYSGNGDDPATSVPEEPVLPQTAHWELAVDHPPGGTWLPLEIPDDGSFVEPRVRRQVELRITFEESFELDDIYGAIFWIAVNSENDPTFHTSFALAEYLTEDQVDLARRRVDIPLDFNLLPFAIDEDRDRFVATMSLADRSGAVLGRRAVARLVGDVNGDRTVSNSDRDGADGIDELSGSTPVAGEPDYIRADLDCDGIVSPADPGGDAEVVAWNLTDNLSGIPTPTLWD